MREFRRKAHRDVAKILASFDAEFLLGAHCYFAGGTQVSLAHNEFRESRDIYFICGDRDGFRKLRETVTEQSLGRVAKENLQLAREVRADRDGIRTFIAIADTRIKFELILEARIDVHGNLDEALGVPALDLDSMVAEKFLANADRGLDESTHSRDLIDLCFIAAAHGGDALLPGLGIAEAAYGAATKRYLELALKRFADDKRLLSACARALDIQDVKTLNKGIAILKKLNRPNHGDGSRIAGRAPRRK